MSPEEKEKFSVPTVAMLLERRNPITKETELLLTLRWRPDYDPKYTGTWETPGGRIRAFENIEEALKREIEEETGLRVVKIHSNKTEVLENKGDKAFSFEPFCCEQFLKGPHPYIGFVFLVEVEGEPKTSEEVKEVRFFALKEVEKLLKEGKIYTYHMGTVAKYLESRRNT